MLEEHKGHLALMLLNAFAEFFGILFQMKYGQDLDMGSSVDIKDTVRKSWHKRLPRRLFVNRK